MRLAECIAIGGLSRDLTLGLIKRHLELLNLHHLRAQIGRRILALYEPTTQRTEARKKSRRHDLKPKELCPALISAGRAEPVAE